ncbi:penicillin acylase family protein [Magnetospirillum molischianum]|uniref:Protein related to penicillin acylase n=1 Tax=Magnetospirillum molischianum DSM 120 TaxID=1150626 RepID=H8FRD0_MAGML|nr:penicillin acylase family protein [Magnetospirillum molischianum]CCG40918.1 Protein related to penicillin acylase [Magnetospirillum molischianum DSM 120]
MTEEKAATKSHRSTRRRWTIIAVNAVALTGLLGGATVWLALMSPLPRQTGRIELSGLSEPVTIARNDRGVPRIQAANREDSWFALGWVHAQDRMWQMETMRRLGSGRISEAVGATGLVSDRFMRTLGLRQQAERSLSRLDEPTRAALTAYANGVNAWLTSPETRLPLEYTLLGVRPEPWSPVDSLLWQKLMALQLAGNWPDDILRARLARRIDSKRIPDLFPTGSPESTQGLSDANWRALSAVIPAAVRPAPASNIWIVSGTRSASGKPILSNDPHLPFTAPSYWYLAEIEAPGMSLAGATSPGLPFHVIGHNDRIAWGFTSAEADTVDLFIEKTDGDNAYRTPEGSRPFTVREEVIKVKDSPDITLRVRETRHGPVISDLIAGDLAGPSDVVAFASTALSDSDTGVQTLMRMNFARDWPGFAAVLRDVQAPALNVGYADVSGTIALTTVGRIPIRRSGNGLTPARGWTGSGDWTGWIPPGKLPQTVNPRSGILINANNRPTPDKYPYLIAALWPETYRAERLREILETRKGMTIADMVAIQGDIVSLQAVEVKDLLTGVEPASERGREAVRLIADWTGEVSGDRPEPLLLATWVANLTRAVFADELGELYDPQSPPSPQALIGAFTKRRYWCDDFSTPAAESCEELIERSLNQSLTDLSADWGHDMSRWRWGDAHRARFTNPVLGQVPLLRRWANLETPTNGDNATLSRGSYRIEGKNFPHVHGPSLRTVFDLSALDDSRYLIVPGQSGHPMSPHYGDQLKDWSDNRSFRLEHGEDWVLTLVPRPTAP